MKTRKWLSVLLALCMLLSLAPTTALAEENGPDDIREASCDKAPSEEAELTADEPAEDEPVEDEPVEDEPAEDEPTEDGVEPEEGSEPDEAAEPPMAAEPTETGILAERVPGSQIEIGDFIVIVCDAQAHAVSLNPAKDKLASADVNIRSTAKRSVLTMISEGTAVFEVRNAGDGCVYLYCAAGYLTSPEAGNGLYFAEEPEAGSAWRFEKDVFLYSPNAAYSGNHNQFLEFYYSYTVYGKRDGADPAPFTMSFYRLGNSDPDDPLTEDNYYYLPVFETSDTHGYLANTSGAKPLYMLAYISDKVKDIRGYGEDAHKDRAILLDGGDIYQGNTMSNLMNGASLAAAYQLMEYDAVTIGNHEFDWGIENTVDADRTMMDYTLGDRTGVNSVPVVSANLYLNGEKVPFAEDYVILEKTAINAEGHELPVRIAVIGFAGNYASDIMYDRFTGAGYSIDTDLTAVSAIAADLEASGACDAAILLVHDEAAATADQLGADTAIDLVLGGHTHQNGSGVTDGGLPYIQPASYGAAFAFCDLAFEAVDGAPVFRRVSNAKAVSTNGNADLLTNTAANADELDPAVVELTVTVLDALSEILGEEIGYITENARRYEYLPGSGDRSTTCGNWVASIAARIGGADVAFVNNGGLRTDVLLDEDTGKRVITRSDIYTMFPFDNKIYIYELTYEELLAALEYSLTDTGRTLLSQIEGIDCYYIDDTVQAIVTADGQAVYVDGAWAEGWKDRTVLVAMNEFIATTDRVSAGGKSNPFCAWNDTERLIACDVVDNEGAFAVLTAEAAENEGRLAIDTAPHFLNRAFTPDEDPVLSAANILRAVVGILPNPDGYTPADAALLLRQG